MDLGLDCCFVGCQLRGRGRRAGSLQETSLKPVSPSNGKIRYRSPSVAELSAAFPAPTYTGARMKHPGGCQKPLADKFYLLFSMWGVQGVGFMSIALTNTWIYCPLGKRLSFLCRAFSLASHCVLSFELGMRNEEIRKIKLARDMGYSAARYGHVMFPENVYEPALRCAELLLEGVGKGWASRTYYSDNGSTAVEIALKMAFHKFSFDQGIALDSDNGILGGRCFDFKLSSLHSFVIVVVTCLIGL
ncbi:hypothetical protein J5N97_024858 [Dioscorea zingiberensis]|uniref:Uncharacterized protein n=1 Tax=Dioscorea zingiberensis TaxID=325984 RepID=A0A9D5C7G3_9LILI|nr:hypothetical protein J5N97_024858 [Dioscorea zingiberensis]